MSLTPGTRLGHYEIVSPLGAGGMGEVYRARDTQLDRHVALKILPESFASDPDRLMRFTREAKTLASLNHPNIAAIYGIEERALVMELVEGQDLSEMIGDHQLSLSDALPIAKQIADALEAAHEAGIIHRDLKPANIKVRADGTVKVLDFGLAKAMDTADGATEATPYGKSNSPTMTSPAMTAMGLILGTAAYMSPEQARGKPVDKRADIWAFGVVLYEMLSGNLLFQGETVSDVLAAVLRADIDLTTLPPSVPPGIRHLLSRCLEKDPRKRLRDIGEARIWLDSPLAAAGGDTTGARQTDRAPEPARRMSRLWPWLAITSTIAAVVLAAWRPRETLTPLPLIRASIQLPPGTEYAIEGANPPNVAISPDGSTIAFAATKLGAPPTETMLYLRRLTDAAATPVPDSAGARVPFFSYDSRSVGFVAKGVLKRASLTGGAPAVITSGISNVWGSVWLPDNTIVYANPLPTGEMLFSVSDKGGTPELLSRVERLDRDNSFPNALDADNLLVTMWTGGLYTDGNIFKYSRKTKAITTQLVEGGGQGHLVGGSHLVYARGPELLAQPYPGGAGQSGAVKMLEGMLTDAAYAASQFDVSGGGALVYAPAPLTPPEAAIVWVSAAGAHDVLFDDPRIETPRLSADGKHIVFVSTDATREKELWTYDVTERRKSRLTKTGGEEYAPTVSTDGSQVFFSAWRDKAGLYRTSVRGQLESLVALPQNRAVRSWSLSADNRWLAVTDDTPGGAANRSGADIGVVDLMAKTLEPKWLTATPFREDQPAFSPDVTLLAYASSQLGDADIWVMPFPADPARPAIPVSRVGGSNPFWSTNGQTLYYLNGHSVMASTVTRGKSVAFSEPRVVFTQPNLNVIGVASDGRFLGVRRTHEPVTRLELVLNWLTELKDKVR
jgi:predicted Ser/Thr protein kinase